MRSRTAISLLLFGLLVCSSASATSSASNSVPKHVRILRSLVGLREHGANRHPFIDKINRRYRVPLGSSWCATVMSFALDSAQAKEPPYRGASARRFGQSRGAIPASAVLAGLYQIQQGDIIVWWHGDEHGTLGHVGSADAAWRGHSGWTNEGNTSSGAGDQRNGDGFYRRWRTIEPYAHFRIRYIVRVKYT